MFSIFNLAALTLAQDSVNLLQTTVHRHLTSQCPDCDIGVNVGKNKSCVAKGDPHMKLWDQDDSAGAASNLYGTYADYWLVKTKELGVMGRMGGVEEYDMAVIKGVAVSGCLMDCNKVLIIPTVNNGEVTFGGDPITEYPWESPNGMVKIKVGTGPNLHRFGNIKGMADRENTFTITLGTRASIQMNQDTFQNLRVYADESLAAQDTGACSFECKDWFNCPGGICDLKDSLFDTPHPQCGEVINRKPCNKLRFKLATADCAASFEGNPPTGASIQNCIEDCCADRDQCPDRQKGGGWATCLIFGDPHIKGFDAAETSKHTFSPIGAHFLVKSDFLSIQANYVSSSYVKAQMEGIAFTGAIVSDAGDNGKHSVIYFRPKGEGGGVVIDATVVMQCKEAAGCPNNLYEDANGHFNITFGPGDDIPELLTEHRPVTQRKNVYALEFKEGAKFLIHEGAGQSIYMRIHSTLLVGVSGECGNFNGDPNDDGHASIDTANSECALQSEIFVPGGLECSAVQINTKCKRKKEFRPFIKQCKQHLHLETRKVKITGSERILLKDCARDCCLGGTCPDGKSDVSDEEY